MSVFDVLLTMLWVGVVVVGLLILYWVNIGIQLAVVFLSCYIIDWMYQGDDEFDIYFMKYTNEVFIPEIEQTDSKWLAYYHLLYAGYKVVYYQIKGVLAYDPNNNRN
jgi:hypothetical protein